MDQLNGPRHKVKIGTCRALVAPLREYKLTTMKLSTFFLKDQLHGNFIAHWVVIVFASDM